MAIGKPQEDLSKKLKKGFAKARRKLVAETKKSKGYLVVADQAGNITKIQAKDL
jgi:hypothetical protein